VGGEAPSPAQAPIQKNFAIPSSEVTGSICRVPSTWFSQRLRLLDVFTSVGLQYGEYQRIKVEWEKGLRPFALLLWFIEIFWVVSWKKYLWYYTIQSVMHKVSFRHSKILPIESCFHNFLRGRLTLRRFTERRNLWTFGDHGFHMIIRYSCQHSHFWSLEVLSRELFSKIQNVPLPNEYSRCRRFGESL
jgi:hypothetical protein